MTSLRRRRGRPGRVEAARRGRPGQHRLRHEGYGGPCPPKGDKPHRYVFTVHALKTDKLDVPANATAALIGFIVNANHLGTASLTAPYGRP